MKIKNNLIVILGISVAAILFLARCETGEKKGRQDTSDQADLIIKNAKIATLNATNDFASALAVKGNKLIAVGDAEEVAPFEGEQTQVIDAKGRTVIPGLNDSHSHVIRGGLNYNLELRWDGVTSLKEALRMLKEQAARTPEGQWVKVVGGWGEFQFEERRLPTLDEINEAVPDKPCMVTFLYTYGMLNKKGIETLGYDKDTSYPLGEVQLDPNGEPTGLLVAKPGAAIIYFTLVKTNKLSPEDQYNSTQHFMRQLNRLGMTSAIDAGGGGQFFPENYGVMKKIAEDRKMTIRIGYYVFAAQKPGEELDAWRRYIDMVSPGDDYDLFRPNGYTMCGAGENLVWSAGDYENFLEPQHMLGDHMEGELSEAITIFAQNKWPFRIHGTYGESIERFLNVFEEINDEYPINENRWIIDHAETVSEPSLDRIKALGGGVAIQNRMMFQGEYFIDRYGEETALNAPPIRKMLDRDIPVGLGTDGTRVSSYNPWLSLYWITTGKTWGGTKHLADENVLSRMEGLRLMTEGSAWFSGEANVKGTLEVGKYADFAMLKSDYFTVSEDEIKTMEAVLTIVDGEIVYGAGEYANLDRELPPVSPSWSPVKYYGGYAGKP